MTVSTSRYEKKAREEKFTDESGDTAESEVDAAGHEVTGRDLISDDPKMIRKAVTRFLSGNEDVLLLTGGTGVSKRDVTIETVRPYFEKEIVGFGELLRRVSFDKIGAAAMLTRATAGVARGKLMVCMPGSPDAVSTALRTFLMDFPHAVFVSRS